MAKTAENISVWRNKVFLFCSIFGFLSVLSEVILFMTKTDEAGLHLITMADTIRTVVVPAGATVIMFFVTLFVKNSSHFSTNVKKGWVCLFLLVICMSLVVTYYDSELIYGLPVLAIFMSTVFPKKSLTIGITVVSELTIIGVRIATYLQRETIDRDFVIDTLVPLLILFFAGVMSIMLGEFNKEKMATIEKTSQNEDKLEREVKIDKLTGLYNRAAMDNYLDRVIAKYDGAPMSLLMIDIDNFKQVNDMYGHQFGDKILVSIANKMLAISGINAMPFRYGGEEMVLVFWDCPLEEAKAYSEELLSQVNELKFPFAPDRNFSFSGGLVAYRPGLQKERWIRLADEQLYKAKASGKNRICL